MQSYHTILEEASAELVEKRSRFIGTICPVTSEKEAADRIAAMRTEHWDATHNCYAWIVREGNLMRYSDDGEPQGTAGVPILEVLRREGVTDLLVIVTRYFGGTLLGAGGLVRAYSKTAKLALDAAQRVEMCECVLFSLSIPYPLYDRVQKLLEDYPFHLIDTAFAEGVTLEIRMREDRYDDFCAAMTELSAGSAAPLERAREFAAI